LDPKKNIGTAEGTLIGIALLALVGGLVMLAIMEEEQAQENQRQIGLKQSALAEEAKKETASPCTPVFFKMIEPLWSGQKARLVVAGREVESLDSIYLYFDWETDEIQVRLSQSPQLGPDPVLKRRWQPQHRSSADEKWRQLEAECRKDPYNKYW